MAAEPACMTGLMEDGPLHHLVSPGLEVALPQSLDALKQRLPGKT